jgi:cytosine deaminase
MILRNARVVRATATGPEWLDVAIGADGRITGVASGIRGGPGLREHDLAGRLVVPGLVDAHQHLDKTLTRRKVPNLDGTLAGAIAAFSRYAARMDGNDIAERAARTLRRCLDHGTVAMRTHANVDPDVELRGVETLVALREDWRDRITLQVVALLTSSAPDGGLASIRWLDGAVALGIDAIGGSPAISDAPLAFLDALFAAAGRHGLPLDLHFDEHLDAERQLFDAVIERTRAHGLQGRVALGHCCALSAMAPAEARRVIDGLAETGIHVITLPAANLFLQGRHADRLPPRGLTRVRELVAAGVPVAAASDNIADPFVPVGSGDLLEIARWTLLAAGLGSNDLATVFDMVTHVPARVIGIGGEYGIRPGARADLLILEGEDAESLVAHAGMSRTVLVGGRVVAGGLP